MYIPTLAAYNEGERAELGSFWSKVRGVAKTVTTPHRFVAGKLYKGGKLYTKGVLKVGKIATTPHRFVAEKLYKGVR